MFALNDVRRSFKFNLYMMMREKLEKLEL